MEKIVVCYRMNATLAEGLRGKARQEERKLTTVLERILREAQERDERQKDVAHAGD